MLFFVSLDLPGFYPELVEGPVSQANAASSICLYSKRPKKERERKILPALRFNG